MAIANTNAGWMLHKLRVKTPTEHKVKGKAGEFNMLSSTHVSEFVLDYADVNLGTTDTNVYILDYDSVLPNGAVVERIEVKVGTAWDSSGNGAKLNVGVVAKDGTTDAWTTITDADGLINSLAETAMDAAGNLVEVVVEGTGAGALLGTALAADSVLCVYQETEAWTAGTAKMYVHWRVAA